MSVIKFGTDGWRDLMYDRFNITNVRLVVQAIAAYTLTNQGQGRGIVLGYDARFFSDFFAREAARVLLANGIKVYLCERDYPTPVVAFAVKQKKAFGAIMFTASHNPPEYNGIKFIPEYAGPASPEITKEIEENLAGLLQSTTVPSHLDQDTTAADGLLSRINPKQEYFKQLRELVDTKAIAKAGLEITVDPMYGSGRGFLPELLEDSSVTEIHNWRDPLFGGGLPDPQEKYLTDLKTAVKKSTNGLGLATDGDADRFGIIDGDGVFFTPNQVIVLLLYHLVKNRGFQGVAVRTVSTTHMLDKLGILFGVETIETPVGFKYIGELMRERPVIIGGEESGGLSIRGHLPEKDGVLACALIAELRAVTGKRLSEILGEIEFQTGKYYTKRLDIHLAEDTKQALLDDYRRNPPERLAGFKVDEVRTKDGFKFLLENEAWCLVRPSGTEPLIRAYIEAHQPADLEKISGALEETVRKWEMKA